MNKLFLTAALAPLFATSLHAAVYTDRSSFQAGPDTVGLVADFEGIVTFAYSLKAVSKPYAATSSISITSNAGLMVLGSGLLGGGTDGLVTDGYSDTMTLNFAGGTDAVGFDYFVGSRWGTGSFNIKVYGATNNLLYSSGALNAPIRVEPNTGDPGSPPPAFFGIDGVGSIYKVEVGGTGVASAGVDNIYSVVPEPSSLVLTSVVLGGALLRRKRVK